LLLEVPAGKTEVGESPVETARRELMEETGYIAGEIEGIGGFYAGPGYSTEYLHLFYATDLKAADNHVDDDEITEVVRIPLKDTPYLIASGEICDSKSVAGLLRVLYQVK